MCLRRPRNERGVQNRAMDKQGNQPWWACVTALQVGSEGEFECPKLNQIFFFFNVIPLERYFLAKLFLLIHVSSIAPAQGWKSSALIARLSETQSPAHVWTRNNVDPWTIFIYFFFSLLWNCNHGRVCQWAWPLIPLELRSTFQQWMPPHRQLCVVLCCATLPPNVFIFYLFFLNLFRSQWYSGKKDVRALWYSTLNICLRTLSKHSIDVSHLSNFEQVYLHTLFKYIKISKFKLRKKNNKNAGELVNMRDREVYHVKLYRP